MCMWRHTHMQAAAGEDDAKNRSRDSWHQLPWLPSTHLFSTAPLPLWEVNHVSLSSLRVPRLREPCVPVNLARMLGGDPRFFARSLTRALARLVLVGVRVRGEVGWAVSNTLCVQHTTAHICMRMHTYANRLSHGGPSLNRHKE